MRINWIAQILSITMNCNSFLCSKTCLESTSWVFRAQPMDFFWGLEVDTWRFLQPWEMDGGMVFSSARSVGALQIWWVKNLKKNKTYILTQQWYEEAIPWAKDDLWKKNSLGSWVQYIYINDYKCMYGCWKKRNGTCFIQIFLPGWCHVQKKPGIWLASQPLKSVQGYSRPCFLGRGGIEGVPLDVHDKTPQTLSLDMP